MSANTNTPAETRAAARKKYHPTRKVADAFVAELAATYSLPRLAEWEAFHVEDTESRYEIGTITYRCRAMPSGQMAAGVRDLQAFIAVSPCAIRGILNASLHLNYRIHSGGSNGTDRRFNILVDHDCEEDNPNPEYQGYIPDDLAYQHERYLREHRRRLEEAKRPEGGKGVEP